MAGPDPAVAQVAQRRPARAGRRRPAGAGRLQRGSGLPRAGRGRRLRGAAGRRPRRGGDRRPRPAARLGRAGRAAPPALLAQPGPGPGAVVRVEVGRDGGPEAAARTARYAALRTAAAEHGARIALGHTLDDQAETVLLGLGRGSGPRSVAGMVGAGRGAVLARRCSGIRRATTRAACAALGAARLGRPVERPTPPTPACGCAPRCCRCSRTCSAAASPPRWPAPRRCCARTSTCSTSWPPPSSTRLHGDGGLPAAEVAALPAALRRRVLRGWLRAAGRARPAGGAPGRRRRPPHRLARAGAGRPTGRRGRRPDVWQAGPAAPATAGARPQNPEEPHP